MQKKPLIDAINSVESARYVRFIYRNNKTLNLFRVYVFILIMKIQLYVFIYQHLLGNCSFVHVT